jgi:hypothetical protein
MTVYKALYRFIIFITLVAFVSGFFVSYQIYAHWDSWIWLYREIMLKALANTTGAI